MIKEFQENEITRELAESIANLACRSFPSSKTVKQRTAEMLASLENDNLENRTCQRFVIFDDEQNVIAHARTFIRDVITELGPLNVLALATVCTDPELRGKGLGAKVTKQAFEQVGKSDWPAVSLFQTPVPEFYEKLNCRIVKNKFVDRTNQSAPDAFPWRDDTVMIYPSDFDWPGGTIDINGPDY